ncbi:MAG TPA: hypothetical protein VF872_05155 [Gaiellaceae bacterium]
MPVWLLIVTGAGAFVALAMLVALALRRVLGRIGDAITATLDHDLWSSATIEQRRSLTHETFAKAEAQVEAARMSSR